MTAQEFNQKYPIGTPVKYFSVTDEPEHVISITRSIAWELGHGEPVVKIKDRTGGVALSNIVVMEMGNLNMEYTEYNKIPCPRCGQLSVDETQTYHVSYWGDRHDLSCCECGHDFVVLESVTRTYEIEEIDS